MITLLMTFGLIYFILWAVFKLLGLAIKIAFFPLKLAFGVLFGILGYVIVPVLAILFIVPIVFIISCWIFSKIFCLA